MMRIISENQTAHTKQFLPVLVPIVALVALTATSRLGKEITTRTNNTVSASDPYKPHLLTAHFNTGEQTFIKYQTASTMASDGQDQAALALLTSLANAPICADGDSFRSNELRGYSPTSLMLGLVNNLSRHAHQLAVQGDIQTARQYTEALYQIGDRFANAQTPTFNSVKIAHHCHSAAAQTEISLASPTNDSALVALRYELAALHSLWQVRIAPEINQAVGKDTVPESVLAARLSREYQDEWTRIRAREV